MKLALRTRIFLAFGLALGVLGLLGVGAWHRNSRIIDGVAETAESNLEISLLASLQTALTDADRAARDYVYDGTPSLLDAFSAARLRAEQQLDSLEQVMRGDSVESRNLAELATLVAAKLEFAATTLAARQGRDGSRAAFQLIVSGRGWRLTDAIRAQLTALQAFEGIELAARSRALEASARSARTISTVSIIATLLIVGLGAAGILGEVEARARAQRDTAAGSALLRETHDELRDLYDHAPCGYHSVDADGLIVRMNDTELQWLGYAREEIVGRMRICDLVTPGSAEGLEGRLLAIKAGEVLTDIELDYVRKDGSILPAWVAASAIRASNGEFVMTRTAVTDITELRRAQDETVKAVADLAAAVASVKTLSGLLPICSLCKNVRDDTGYWKGVEQYVSAHSDATFSHGVCPECFPKMFPELALEDQGAVGSSQ